MLVFAIELLQRVHPLGSECFVPIDFTHAFFHACETFRESFPLRLFLHKDFLSF